MAGACGPLVDAAVVQRRRFPTSGSRGPLERLKSLRVEAINSDYALDQAAPPYMEVDRQFSVFSGEVSDRGMFATKDRKRIDEDPVGLTSTMPSAFVSMMSLIADRMPPLSIALFTQTTPIALATTIAIRRPQRRRR